MIQFHAIYEQETVIPITREFNLGILSDRLEVLGIVRNIAVLLPNLAGLSKDIPYLPECIPITRDSGKEIELGKSVVKKWPADQTAEFKVFMQKQM